MEATKFRPILLWLILAAAILFIQTPLFADGNERALSNQMSCRYGTSTTAAFLSGSGVQWDVDWLQRLGIGWYLNFTSTTEPAQASEYYVMFGFRQKKDANGNLLPKYVNFESRLRNTIARTPTGSIWLLGNEPDTDRQNGLVPEIYAEAFHDAYAIIKEEDPTALVANAGLVSATRNRMYYLSLVWDSYLEKYGEEMPVDIWNMHLYILPEADANGGPVDGRVGALGTDGRYAIRGTTWNPDDCRDPYDNRYCYSEHDSIEIFKTQVRNMRQWMADHGQQDKPLILTEYSILFPYFETENGCQIWDENRQCFGPDRVIRYMHDTLDFMENERDSRLGYTHDDNRLVQQWLWFTTYSPGVGSSSSLLDLAAENISPASGSGLTPVGEAYVARARRNLKPDLALIVPSIADGGSGDDATLRVQVINQGDVNVTRPFRVNFYSNASMTRLLGSVRLTEPVRGCARQLYDVELDLPPQTADSLRYWVKVDYHNSVNEDDETNNIASGTLLLDAERTYFPSIYYRGR